LVSIDRLPLFGGTPLAARIERAEADLITQGTEAALRRSGGADGFAVAFGGGVASYAQDGSPLNKVAGLGFAGVPSASEFDEIERAFAAVKAPVQVELSHLSDPAIAALLTERDYRLVSFENVLGRALDGELERVEPTGVEVRLSGPDEFEPWLDTLADGFANPDTQGVVPHEEFPREVIATAMRDLISAAGVIRYAARCDGQLAGAASMRLRRRGVQSALLSARMVEAAAHGCEVAVITTAPGSKSQQNAQRRGFDLLYTRAILVKQPL
jgi:hypothetical protein